MWIPTRSSHYNYQDDIWEDNIEIYQVYGWPNSLSVYCWSTNRKFGLSRLYGTTLILRILNVRTWEIMWYIEIEYWNVEIGSICRLTSVDPVIVHINGFWQIIDVWLETLHTNTACYPSSVFRLIQFDFTTLLVIAKRTIELSIERLDRPVLWWRLPLTLLLSHGHSELNSGVFTEMSPNPNSENPSNTWLGQQDVCA